MKIEGEYIILDGTEVNGKPAQLVDEYRYRIDLRNEFRDEWFRVGGTAPYTTDDHYQIRRPAPKAGLDQHFI